MATIAQIQNDLVKYATAGNVTLFNQTLASITATQKPLISQDTYALVISIAYQNSTDATGALLLGNLMKTLGSYVSVTNLAEGIDAIAVDGSFQTLDAFTDYLTPAQKTGLTGHFHLNNALSSIVGWDGPGTTDDAKIKTAVNDFMSKLGAQVSAPTIADAAARLSANGNFGALDAVTDYLTTAQKTMLAGHFQIDDTLSNIVGWDGPGTTDDAKIKTAVNDFMSKLGAQVSAPTIADAAARLSANGNFGALDAVTDYLTTAQKTMLAGHFQINDTLSNIVGWDGPGTTDDAKITTAVNDFMSKLGTQVSAPTIADAAARLSQSGNFGALDAVTDYLTTAQKTMLAGHFQINDTLSNIVGWDGPGTTDDGKIRVAVIDFMSKLGAQVSARTIGDAMITLSLNGNFGALDGVTDYLTTAQKTAIGGFEAGITLSNLVGWDSPGTTTDDVKITEIVRDLMSKIGAQINPFDRSLGEAMNILALNGNFKALDAVTDYLTSAQKTNIVQSASAGLTLDAIAQWDNPGTYADNKSISYVVRDFMEKFGAQLDGASASHGINVLVNAANVIGTGSILDYTAATKIDATAKAALAVNGFTLGTDAANTINGGTGADKVFALNGNDTVRGNAGNDQIYGNAGNDILYGDAGNDTLAGGLGVDNLSGGLGADTFVFDTLKSAADTVTDFSRTQGDKLDLTNVIELFDPVTDAINTFVYARNSGANTIISVDADGMGPDGLVTKVDVAVILNVNNVNVTDWFNTGNIVA